MMDLITQGRKNHIEIFERWFLITGIFSEIVRLDSRYFCFVIPPLIVRRRVICVIGEIIELYVTKIQCVTGRCKYNYTMPDINNVDAGFCNNLYVPAQHLFSKARFFWQVSLEHWCLFSFLFLFFLEYDCADLIQVYSLFSTQFSQFWKAI